jgi:hypothetical protein
MSSLRVGGVEVDRDAALEHARRYLTDGAGWAYPSYDGFDAEHATGPLTDADFLAPILLNVNQLKIRTYEALQAQRQPLDEVLAHIPPDLDLAVANADELNRLGSLFGVLDGEGIHGAQGTVLAKVLHRKRPHFIPLYDERVRAVYQRVPCGPVPRVRGRSWRAFMVVFAGAVQHDLREEAAFWARIADMAPGPTIPPLRALDIVAWWAGRPGAAGG